MAAKTGLKPRNYAATACPAVRCCCACWTRCAISCAVTLTSDAAFTLLRDRDALMLVHGQSLQIECPKGPLQIRLEEPASLVAEATAGTIKQKLAADIEYDTYGGVDHPRPAPKAKVILTGGLWSKTPRPATAGAPVPGPAR
jgi:hypothetical protein